MGKTKLTQISTKDHGGLVGLGDNDHIIYVLRSILSANGDIFIRSGGVIARLAKGSDGQILELASGIPSWQTKDHGGLAGLGDNDHTIYVLRSILSADGDIFIRSGGVIARLAKGSNGQILELASGIPSWQDKPAQPSQPSYVVNDDLIQSADTERSTSSNGTPVKLKEMYCAFPSTYRIKFDLKGNGAANSGIGQIYKNGSPFGIQRQKNSTSYTTFSEDLAVVSGDLIQIYNWNSGEASVSFVENFRIYGCIWRVDTD